MPAKKILFGRAQLNPNEKQKLELVRRVFVSRALNMSKIQSIGFDMDHTLLPYKRQAFETLAFRETLKKFIEAGYPEELSTLKFDPQFLIRGLLIDVERGNILKVDGHKYVKKALHGHQVLTKEERNELYNRDSYKAQEFLSVDTFFALSEVHLFSELVEYMNQNPGKITKSFAEVYTDIKTFIDRSHQDGSIKNPVLEQPEKYLVKDKFLPQTLMRFINSGKHLFVLTNSKWDYTNAVMEYILGGNPKYHWSDYFDHVIVGAGKPNFFTGTQPFYEVQNDSGLLKIINGPLETGKIYHGGNASLFQKMTGYTGDQILYVGDHILGDIIHPKGQVNWRTMLIIEELEDELPRLEKIKSLSQSISKFLEHREVTDERLHILKTKRAKYERKRQDASAKGIQRKKYQYEKNLADLDPEIETNETKLTELDAQIKDLINSREEAFHPIWGELMRVGLEKSRFAHQVASYACIYSSKVSNLRHYSPFKRYISSNDLMPHDNS